MEQENTSNKKSKTEKEVKQIPGYYFDHEKGKYFRIEKNQQLIQMNKKEDATTTSPSPVYTLHSTPKTVNIFNWIQQRNEHSILQPHFQIEPCLWKARFKELSYITHGGYPESILGFDKLIYPYQFKNQNTPFLIYWHRNNNALLREISFSESKTITFRNAHQKEVFSNSLTNINTLLAKHIKGNDILFASTSGAENISGSVFLQQMNPSPSLSKTELIFRAKEKTVWNISVAENGLISVAASKVGYLFDLETKKKIRSFFDISHGDAFVHEFLDANTLVCGFRDGSVKLIDLRTSAQSSTRNHFQHTICTMQSSVTFMKPFVNSRKGSILIGSLIGELQLYDIRFSNRMLIEFGKIEKKKKDLNSTYLFETDVNCKYVFKCCNSVERGVEVWDSNQQTLQPLKRISTSTTESLSPIQFFTTLEDVNNNFVDSFNAFLLHEIIDRNSFATSFTEMI